MDTVTKYLVIKNDNLSYLIIDINDKILEGWQPIGGIAVVAASEYTYSDKTTTYYLQAIIK